MKNLKTIVAVLTILISPLFTFSQNDLDTLKENKYNLNTHSGYTHFFSSDKIKNVSNPNSGGFHIKLMGQKHIGKFSIALGAGYLYNINNNNATIIDKANTTFGDSVYLRGLNNKYQNSNEIANIDILSYHGQLEIPFEISREFQHFTIGLGASYRMKFYNKTSVFVEFVDDIGLTFAFSKDITKRLQARLGAYSGLTNETFDQTFVGYEVNSYPQKIRLKSHSMDIGIVYSIF